MPVHTLLVAICLSLASAVFAQGSGEIAYFHLNRVKPGMTAQYETTRKRHWLWHKRLGDTWSYQVWQIVSGDRTGAYIISSFGHTWKEVDESDKLVGGDEDPGASVDPYVASESESYYRYLPELSLAPQTFSPAPMLSVTRFVVKPEEITTFQDGLKKVRDAIRKTNYPLSGPMRWYQLATGGEGPQFLLLSDRANWADYEPRSPKTLDAMMEEAYGKEQGTTTLRAFRAAARSEYMETWRYRSDLSFVAATSGSTEAPVPVDQEPHHHVVLKNAFVEVIRATLPARAQFFTHTLRTLQDLVLRQVAPQSSYWVSRNRQHQHLVSARSMQSRSRRVPTRTRFAMSAMVQWTSLLSSYSNDLLNLPLTPLLR